MSKQKRHLRHYLQHVREPDKTARALEGVQTLARMELLLCMAEKVDACAEDFSVMSGAVYYRGSTLHGADWASLTGFALDDPHLSQDEAEIIVARFKASMEAAAEAWLRSELELL